MKSIKNKLSEIKSKIDEKVTVVAVSKTKPIDDILKIYEDGHFDFGENKVQELIVKNKELPKDIKWHMIGHLQRNKVKQIISFIYLIHSVDSIRVLNKINDEAKKINRKVNVLLQVKISENDLRKQQVSGFYRDVELGRPADNESALEKKERELEGVKKTRDEDIYSVLEVHTDLDLEGFEDKDSSGEMTGIKLPYIVTLEMGSREI